MQGHGLGAVIFALTLLVSVALPRIAEASSTGESAVLVFAHFRKVQSFYCYPRTYWWFYRPYTTAPQNYARCMPYFHYLDEAFTPRIGGKPPLK
jgi:hypothetical protein